MLYKKNSSPSLTSELFKNPTCEYRGTPFWAWNSRLTASELERQIDIFKEMGLGGFHMHVRTGLENEYLSDEYMDLVNVCIDKAKKEEMLAWAYDEDRWPSGAAGGIVTKDVKYRQKGLLFSYDRAKTEAYWDEHKGNREKNALTYITSYDIVLDEKGYLKSYKQIGKDDAAKGYKWTLYWFYETDSSWYNDQAYVDTMDRESMKRFIDVTHERYAEKCGDEFDKTLPAIFTDEPQVLRKQNLNNSFDTDRDIIMPWTLRFPDEYRKRHNADVFDYLPEVIWELPPEVKSPHRYYYHDLVSELFTDAFADQIGDWCEEHNIALTGHMMEEPTLRSQTAAISEAMRSYRGFGIPGIDMLCNRTEFTTAKQCQSAVHQYGREAMLSELYGVTAWDADFRIYKFGGDWQAALGVTVRVPHLSWYSMNGEAKRDYPASIHYQSPWYKKYNLVEDHFARVNTALTRGKPVVKVGVIHPIESYWLHWGPNDKTLLARQPMDERFEELTKWLLEGGIDFDFISESLLPELCEKGDAPLTVGEMKYDAIVVPGCETLRSTTVERLDGFRKAGGKLIFMGSAPTLVDAIPSDMASKLYGESKTIDYNCTELLNSLEDNRVLTMRTKSGQLTTDFIYQMRQDADCRWLFICRDKIEYNKDVAGIYEAVLTLPGIVSAEEWDTSDGSIKPLDVKYERGNTVINLAMYNYRSYLIKITDGEKVTVAAKEPEMTDYVQAVCDGYELSEDNVLVLDRAEWNVDDGEIHPAEEILRLDNMARKLVGLRTRGGGIVQPWVVGDVPSEHKISLKFTFNSDIDYKGAYLALEQAADSEILFNGEDVDIKIDGWYVDKCIGKIALPEIKKGVNVLTVTQPLGARSNTENMFILGTFGVRLEGTKGAITTLPEKIYFTDLVYQGLPFYGGAVTYKFKAKSMDGKLNIKANYYRGAVMWVKVDGKDAGSIIYPPYVLSIDGIENGEHDVELTIYLNRYNSFGPLHLVDEMKSWHGPDAWRLTNDSWTDEFVLRRMGLLGAPKIF